MLVINTSFPRCGKLNLIFWLNHSYLQQQRDQKTKCKFFDFKKVFKNQNYFSRPQSKIIKYLVLNKMNKTDQVYIYARMYTINNINKIYTGKLTKLYSKYLII